MRYDTVKQTDSTGRRAAAYWFADGLPEIVFGFFFFVVGASIVIWIESSRQNWWLRSFIFLMSFFNAWIWILYRPICNFLKARITYPRTGYVKPPSDILDKDNPDAKILTLGTVHSANDNVSTFASRTIPIIYIGAAWAVILPWWWNLPLATIGIAAAIHLFSRNDARPYSWTAVLPIAIAGLIASPLRFDRESRGFATALICGAWLLTLGTWRLIHYLKDHHKPHVEREGCL